MVKMYQINFVYKINVYSSMSLGIIMIIILIIKYNIHKSRNAINLQLVENASFDRYQHNIIFNTVECYVNYNKTELVNKGD